MARRLKDIGAIDEDEDVPAKPQPKKGEKKPITEVAAPEFEKTRLHNGQLEFLSLIRVVLDSGLQGRLWPRFNEDHFASDTSRAIFQRLHTLQVAGREWPKLATLALDPALPPAAQSQLQAVVARVDHGLPLAHHEVSLGNGNTVPVEASSDFEGHVFDLLESYRVTRAAVEQYVEVIQTLADDHSFDPLTGPDLVEKAATAVMSLRGRESVTDALLHFGHGTTADDTAKRQNEVQKLFAADKPRFKTGLITYDQKAGGFQPGEVILLGANTGAGKTAMALTMMCHMSRMGTSAAMLQLELTLSQLNERLASNLANIDSEAVRTGKLTSKQQERISESFEEFHDECKNVRSRFTIFAPSAATVAGCEMVFKQYPYKVWFIDYINLIQWEGIGKDQDWLKLSEIVKEFKRLAKKYGIAIVLNVQVNIDKDTGDIEIRYSKAMKEHADVVMAWNMTPEARKEGVIWLRHLKARQYEPFDFPVRIALNHCRFESMSLDLEPKAETRKLGGRRRVVTDDDMAPAPAPVKLALVPDPTFQKKTKPLATPEDASPKKSTLSLDVEGNEYEEFDS